ncbi:MAG: CDGSH iron-sulfur domain-containing protein [Bacteroidales bacterium]|nr:CDGSH iron-sulfur domain-containing protein [Bacteroidales bacterium]
MENGHKSGEKIPEVRILKDGPIMLKGFFRFRTSSGEETQKEHEIYICSCGKSGNKPYCDETHKKSVMSG